MGEKELTGFSEIAAQHEQLHPQEKLLESPKDRKTPITIGIPTEINSQERRVALRPEAVGILINNGFDVRVETGAGDLSKHHDQEYSEQGAQIIYSTEDVYKCELILKVSPPSFEEIELMQPNATLVSALNVIELSQEYLQALNKKRITAIGYELMQDEECGLPLVRAMSEIAGSTVMLIAGEYLSNNYQGKGIILGGVTGVPPTKVVIIGAGTVAEYAARTAMGLGAEVKVFDNQIFKLSKLKERLHCHQLYTSAIDSVMLQDALIRADVVIGALRSSEGGRSPIVITENMVAQMKPNSVIIDVSIDHGGCCETSHPTTHLKPTFRKFDVIHYCVPNIASRVARTATTAISNIFTPMLVQIGDLGGVDRMIYARNWFAKGVYAYKGCVTNEMIAKKLEMRYTNLDLVIATHTG